MTENSPNEALRRKQVSLEANREYVPQEAYREPIQRNSREPSKLYEDTSVTSNRGVNEHFVGATHSPLREKQISYVNSMSFDENRFEK